MTILRRFALLPLLLLASCGGGGNGGSESGYAVRAAWQSLLTSSSSWQTVGVASDRQTWRLQSTFAPGLPRAFPVTGEVVPNTTQTTQVTVNGSTLGSAAINLFFTTDTLLRGDQDDGGVCGFALGATAAPERASVGDAGTLATLRNLISCTQTQAWNGLRTVGWSIEAEGAIVFFCVDTTLIAASGSPVLGTQRECYETTPGGVLGPRARVSLNLVDPAFSLVARNY